MTDKGDLIETVANTLIERLENFSGEWEKPFFTSFARNVATVRIRKKAAKEKLDGILHYLYKEKTTGD